MYPNKPLSCDFEKDYCTWLNQTGSGSFMWQRSKGIDLADINGPLADHTTQSSNGHYIYLKVPCPNTLFKSLYKLDIFLYQIKTQPRLFKIKQQV